MQHIFLKPISLEKANLTLTEAGRYVSRSYIVGGLVVWSDQENIVHKGLNIKIYHGYYIPKWLEHICTMQHHQVSLVQY